MLKITDLDKEIAVCTYSCKRGLGGVLMQDGHVVCYESQKLNEHEKNYQHMILSIGTCSIIGTSTVSGIGAGA